MDELIKEDEVTMDIQEVTQKLTHLESRVDKTDGKIERLEDRVYTAESSIRLIQQNMDQLIKNTDDIKCMVEKSNLEFKNDLKELAQKRESDHYIKPMENTEKLKFQAIGILMGILLSGFVGYLIPVLGK